MKTININVINNNKTKFQKTKTKMIKLIQIIIYKFKKKEFLMNL